MRLEGRASFGGAAGDEEKLLCRISTAFIAAAPWKWGWPNRNTLFQPDFGRLCAQINKMAEKENVREPAATSFP